MQCSQYCTTSSWKEWVRIIQKIYVLYCYLWTRYFAPIRPEIEHIELLINQDCIKRPPDLECRIFVHFPFQCLTRNNIGDIDEGWPTSASIHLSGITKTNSNTMCCQLTRNLFCGWFMHALLWIHPGSGLVRKFCYLENLVFDCFYDLYNISVKSELWKVKNVAI